MANAGVACCKILTFVINVIFFFSGAALIAIGSYAIADSIEGLTSTTLAALIIVIGILVTITAFLGCVGAMSLNRGMLKAYAIFIIIFMLIEITIGVVAYVYRDDIPQIAEESWQNAYDRNPETLADIQNHYECCGWADTSDHVVLPCSYQQPCHQIITDEIQNNLYYIGVAAITIGCLQIFCIIISCCLISRIPTKEEKEKEVLDEARRLNRDTHQGAPPQGYQSAK